MRATVMFGARDVRIETLPDARAIEPTDAVVVVSRACICGSDLWPYKTMEHSETGRRMRAWDEFAAAHSGTPFTGGGKLPWDATGMTELSKLEASYAMKARRN